MYQSFSHNVPTKPSQRQGLLKQVFCPQWQVIVVVVKSDSEVVGVEEAVMTGRAPHQSHHQRVHEALHDGFGFEVVGGQDTLDEIVIYRGAVTDQEQR